MDFRDTSYSRSYQVQDDFYPVTSHESSNGSSNAILNALSAEMFARLKPSVKSVHLAKDEFLYQEEDPLTYVYFPETAVVSELKILEDGRTV